MASSAGRPVSFNVINPRAEIERKNEFRPTLVKPGATIGQRHHRLRRRLGEYCFIAAGVLVTKDVPPFALVAGVPARHRLGRHSGEWLGRISSARFGRRYRPNRRTSSRRYLRRKRRPRDSAPLIDLAALSRFIACEIEAAMAGDRADLTLAPLSRWAGCERLSNFAVRRRDFEQVVLEVSIDRFGPKPLLIERARSLFPPL